MVRPNEKTSSLIFSLWLSINPNAKHWGARCTGFYAIIQESNPVGVSLCPLLAQCNRDPLGCYTGVPRMTPLKSGGVGERLKFLVVLTINR